MFNYLWPVAVVVGANVVYHISAKGIPAEVDPFASLTVTYVIAAILSAIIFFTTSHSKNLAAEIGLMNWTTFALGAAVVALEIGSIYIYRVGWDISIGSLVANISLACILLVIGVLFYKDAITAVQLGGIALCLVGLVLITK